jgi:Homeodomain-like domain
VTVRLMSDRELQRLEVLRDLDQRRLTTTAAGQLMRLERRQVFRLLKAYRLEGATGLISKRRGRRSNRRKPEALRRAVLTLIRQWYLDFGPTLAAEKLREDHGIAVGRETLRQWMIDKYTGQAISAVASFAGFSGSANSCFRCRGRPSITRRGGYVVDIDRARLESAPCFKAEPAPDWSDPGLYRRDHQILAAAGLSRCAGGRRLFGARAFCGAAW